MKQNLGMKWQLPERCVDIKRSSFTFNQLVKRHIDQQGIIVNYLLTQLSFDGRTKQQASVLLWISFFLCTQTRNIKSITDDWSKLLTESNDGQDDGDTYGHPGHPQSFLAVTLCFMRFQPHAALQKTCRQQHRAQWPTMHRYDSEQNRKTVSQFDSVVTAFNLSFHRKYTWFNWSTSWAWQQNDKLRIRDYLWCYLLLNDNNKR